MNQKTVKQISSFGRTIIVVFFVSIASWLQKIESYDIQNDLNDLNLIATIKGEPEKYTLNDSTVYRNTIRWLDEHHPELSNRRREARGEILEWLTDQGLTTDVVFRLAGKSLGLGSREIPFHFIQFVDRTPDEETASENKLMSLGTVNEVIDKLDSLAMPINISCIKSLKTNSFPQLPPDQFTDRMATQDLSVSLRRDKLNVRLRKIYANAATQTTPDSFSFPVETETVTGPSYMELKNASNPLNESFIELYQLDERKRYLRKTYGHLPIVEAQKIVADSLTQAYKSISILGFSFSTRKFPFAVVFFSLISLIATMLIIHRSRPAIKVEPPDNRLDPSVEEPDSLLYQNMYLRALVWIALPVVSVFAAIPIIPLTASAQILIYIFVAIIFLLGLATVILSKDF